MPLWKIRRIKSTPLPCLVVPRAPNPERAIEIAIEEFGITNREQQMRLVRRAHFATRLSQSA
jgi:hypothetical protein